MCKNTKAPIITGKAVSLHLHDMAFSINKSRAKASEEFLHELLLYCYLPYRDGNFTVSKKGIYSFGSHGQWRTDFTALSILMGLWYGTFYMD